MQSLVARRSLGSDLRVPPAISINLTQNDDDSERSERSRRASLEAGLNRSPRSSPISSDSYRNSFNTLANFNSVQLTEHFLSCMKLSNENKINARNAFKLQLIDYMAMMLKRQDPNLDNFQLASCTLDASAKIYSYRVDCVHNDTVKIVTSLLRTDIKRKDHNESGEDEVEKNRPVTKKQKRHLTVERNINVLNFKSELDLKVDPFFKRMSTVIDEGKAGGCHFLSSLIVLDETQDIITSSDRTWWREAGHEENPTEKVTIPVLNFEAIRSAELCPSFSHFTFTGWFPENSEITAGSEFEPFYQDRILRRDSAHCFDLNAPPEPIDLQVDNVLDDHSGGTVEVLGFEERSSGRSSSDFIELKNALSLDKREYSYFKKNMGWAGPSHWNIKCIKKVNRAKRKAKRKLKIVVTLEYEQSLPTLPDFFKQSGKDICLSESTILKWNELRTTFPEDLLVAVSSLETFFMKQKRAINPKNSEDMELVGVNPSDYGNLNDREDYCSNVEDFDNLSSDNDEDVKEMDAEDSPENSGSGQSVSGFNLVEPPRKVPKFSIPYIKTAKRVNMKRLKYAVFRTLTHQNKEGLTDVGPKGSEPPVVTGEIIFSKVYQELPKLLPPIDAQDLSFPLAFSALLHVANDNILALEAIHNYSDIVISQGEKLC